MRWWYGHPLSSDNELFLFPISNCRTVNNGSVNQPRCEEINKRLHVLFQTATWRLPSARWQMLRSKPSFKKDVTRYTDVRRWAKRSRQLRREIPSPLATLKTPRRPYRRRVHQLRTENAWSRKKKKSGGQSESASGMKPWLSILHLLSHFRRRKCTHSW